MGNQNNGTCKDMERARKSRRPNDDFIIKHMKHNKDINDLVDIETLDQRRLVFVSLIGLYQSYKQVPSVVLYTSVFIMPLKRKWVYNKSKYLRKLQSNFISHIPGSDETNEFIKLLKWKDSQGLCLWMLDNYESIRNEEKNNSLVNPFWIFVNDMLANLYNPISGENYKPINCDEHWWKNQLFVPKYTTNTTSILNELFYVTMKYDPIMELIYQSNPMSLMPIITYNNKNKSMALKDNISGSALSDNTVASAAYDSDLEDKDDYCFVGDYDMYDVDVDIDIDIDTNNNAYESDNET